MRGEILNYDAAGEGLITASDFLTYRFTGADMVAGKPSVGAQVDFFAERDGRASRVVVLGQAEPYAARGPLDLGIVVRRTFASIARNWRIMFTAAAVLVGAPGVLAVLAQAGVIAASWWSGPVFTGGLYFLGLFVLQGLVMKAAINGFNGVATDFRAGFDITVGSYLPLIGLGIVAAVATTIGFLLLLIPGLILCVIWAVAAPALVVERLGIMASLQRSRQITQGYRWPIFGLFVVYMVLSLGLVLAIRALGGWNGPADGASGLAKALVAGPVIDVISAVIGAAGTASLYYELRTVKEGALSEDLAAVFD